MLRLLATGGTIAARETPMGRAVDVDGAELVEAARAVGELPAGGIEVRDVAGTTSFSARSADVLALADQVRAATTDADGVVITHGTDTLEETAALLAVTHTSPVPVVLTGAQRPFDDPATDGPHNLRAALRWAASPGAAGSGVTVVFADRVFPAIGVRKTHTSALAAFEAPGRGALGQIEADGIRRQVSVRRPPPLLSPGATELPRVDIVPLYQGADAVLVESVLAAGAQGIVLAAMGAGNATHAVTRACVQALENGIPVAVTSRVGEGAVAGLYAGGGWDLAEAGAIFFGDLSPWQGRVVLAAALAAGDDLTGTTRRCRQWLSAAGALPG